MEHGRRLQVHNTIRLKVELYVTLAYFVDLEKTNVYEFSQSLVNGDIYDSKGMLWEQMHTYYSGLGTDKYRILGGVFGYGISGQITSAYKYICKNYRSEQDEIWLLGFSRGGN